MTCYFCTLFPWHLPLHRYHLESDGSSDDSGAEVWAEELRPRLPTTVITASAGSTATVPASKTSNTLDIKTTNTAKTTTFRDETKPSTSEPKQPTRSIPPSLPAAQHGKLIRLSSSILVVIHFYYMTAL